MAGPTPPDPGVSAIGETGARTTVATPQQAKDEALQGQAPRKATRSIPRHSFSKRIPKNKMRRPEDDVLLNPEDGRQVSPSAPPPGSTAVGSDIRQFDNLVKMRRSVRATRSYESVDGLTYTFRTRDAQGKPLASRMVQTLFLAIRELRLGGDPFVVFDAFGLKISDIDGQQIFPVPEEILHQMVDMEPEYGLVEDHPPGLEETEEDDGFSLGT